ncbi:MAG: polyamine ABC transporter substrate-binding protein [Proteobacteria bacterium]|nr:polyamine ABC transporter substrate-binding protein [Pseudomonadota bacterium]MDA1059155.1 polyamine ABC transporter substrate-binding protein [Pseudomonadota bacterium]
MRALFRLALALPFAALLSVPVQAQEEAVLNVYNWSDYITDEALARFTAETGIKVNYDVYDSNEILEAKLLAGNSGYDVVFPSATPFFAKQIRAGAYRPLDPRKLPNAALINPDIMQQLALADPNNAHGVPYMMAGTGIGYNVDKVRALMPDAPVDSLALILDPQVLFKLKGCGVTLLDAPEETFPAALAFAGRSPNSTTAEDMKIATEVLTAARVNYRYIHSSAYINDLANGATCVAMGYAGDLVQARERARESGSGVNIRVYLPREGAAFNIDVMAIPADAPHPDNAHKFINFLLTPDVIGPISGAVGYANAVPDSNPHIDETIRNDPAVNPPPGTKLYTFPLVEADFERTRSRAWARLKAKRR